MQLKSMLSVEEICQKLRPFMGEKIDKLYFNYVTTESNDVKEDIFSMLHALYQKYFNGLLEGTVHLEPPRKEDVSGDFTLGNVLYGNKSLYPFSLREHDLPRHVCISGMSGSGKTTIAFNILESFIAKDKPFLVFDWKKSFRPLLHKDPSLTCFTVGDNTVTNNFKLNLNRPPQGVSPKEWIVVICDLIAESFFVSYGVHKVLLETLDESFKEWGVYSGSNNYPTWNHIKWRLEEKMEKAKSRTQTWLESALRVATVLTFGDFGSVLNYKGEETISIEDIMNKRVVFELNSLGTIEKKFFSELMLMYIYKLKKAKQNNVNEGFDYAILVDEAHNIFLKDKTNFASESVTDRIYRELREYGISLICLDQHLSKLSDTVKGNSACHIAFQQQLPEDIDSVSRLMQLNDKKEIFSKLQVGTAVAKMSDRYTRPFFISVPNNEGRVHVVSEQEMISRVKKFHLKNDYVKGQDVAFTSQVEQGGKLVMSDLFTKVTVPQEKPFVNAIEEEDNPMRATIFATIRRRLTNGEDLASIEKDMASLYDPTEVAFAMNQFLEAELRKRDVRNEIFEEEIAEAIAEPQVQDMKEYDEPQGSIPVQRPVIMPTVELGHFVTPKSENKKVYKESFTRSNNLELTDEENKFIVFLENNPDHELTTVNLYKAIGFSPRKGNKIKNQLMEKNALTVEEIRDERGWKKIIRLH